VTPPSSLRVIRVELYCNGSQIRMWLMVECYGKLCSLSALLSQTPPVGAEFVELNFFLL